MPSHNDIIPEAEKFLGDKTFLDTRSLFEAAEADAVDVGVGNLYRCMRTGKHCYGGCDEEEGEE